MLSSARLLLLGESGASTALTDRGITRLTVTVVVIMFELTGALTYLLPVMVSGRPPSH
jgi:H+/Cl- antiporter ClcA